MASLMSRFNGIGFVGNNNSEKYSSIVYDEPPSKLLKSWFSSKKGFTAIPDSIATTVHSNDTLAPNKASKDFKRLFNAISKRAPRPSKDTATIADTATDVEPINVVTVASLNAAPRPAPVDITFTNRASKLSISKLTKTPFFRRNKTTPTEEEAATEYFKDLADTWEFDDTTKDIDCGNIVYYVPPAAVHYVPPAAKVSIDLDPAGCFAAVFIDVTEGCYKRTDTSSPDGELAPPSEPSTKPSSKCIKRKSSSAFKGFKKLFTKKTKVVVRSL